MKCINCDKNIVLDEELVLEAFLNPWIHESGFYGCGNDEGGTLADPGFTMRTTFVTEEAK